MYMRVLVIEDEYKVANALREGLTDEGYAVDLSRNGDDGFAMATTEEYDLIILDRMLPGGKDGSQIAKELRDQKVQTPILLLTAKAETYDKVYGLDAGADDYMTKPFSFEELLARIRALLRRPKDSHNVILSSDTVALNTRTFEVSRNDKKVQLSRKEYALLEYFLRHQGQILTKEAIIAHVWNYDADILPNTVEAYIRYLRNKLEKPFKGAKLIHTVHGFGYKYHEN